MILDCGIEKSMRESDPTVAREGDVVGTPYYLSPEQASGHGITPMTDLYSVGVMMFEMLAGRRPFVADSLTQLLSQHVTAPTPDLPAAHAHLQPIVHKLMAKKPEERYGSAQALLADLERLRASTA